MREALHAALILVSVYIIDARLCGGFFFETVIDISELVANFD